MNLQQSVNQSVNPNLSNSVPVITDSTDVWSEKEVKYLTRLKEYADKVSISMEKSYKKFTIQERVITIPTLVLTSINSLASFGIDQFRDIKEYIPLAVGVTSSIVGILNAINSYLEISVNRNICKNATRELKRLSKEIELELSLDISNRNISGLNFSRSCFSKMQAIYSTLPITKFLSSDGIEKTIPQLDLHENTNYLVRKTTIFDDNNLTQQTYAPSIFTPSQFNRMYQQILPTTPESSSNNEVGGNNHLISPRLENLNHVLDTNSNPINNLTNIVSSMPAYNMFSKSLQKIDEEVEKVEKVDFVIDINNSDENNTDVNTLNFTFGNNFTQSELAQSEVTQSNRQSNTQTNHINNLNSPIDLTVMPARPARFI